MDFWRAYRVLSRRKWIIVTAVLLAAALAGGGIILFGQLFDATTFFGPTDQAVHNAVNAGNEGLGMAVTDEARSAEANRIATEIASDGNIGRAVYSLANASNLRAQLEEIASSHGESLEDSGSDINAPDYDKLSHKVQLILHGDRNHRIQPLMSEDAIKDLEMATGIQSSIWADFVYLDLCMRYSNIPREPLQVKQLPDTVADLVNMLQKNGPVVQNARDITLSVRDRNPRFAEILASAITATYKAYYDDDKRNSAEKNLEFLTAQQKDASRALDNVQARVRRFRNDHKEAFNTDQMSLAIRRNEAARNEKDRLTASIKDLDAQISAKKARLASLPRMLSHKTEADNPEIQTLRDRLADMKAQLAEKQGIYTDKNPEVQRLKDQTASLESRLKQVQGSMVGTNTVTENDEWTSLDREIAALEQTRKGLQARWQNAASVMTQASAQMVVLPDISTYTTRLNGEYAAAVDRLNKVNKSLSAAEEELARTDASSALIVHDWAGNLQSTSHPEIPARKGAARKNVMMFIGAILMALIGSTGVILGLDYLDTSLKTPADVELMLGNPVSGIVPRLDGGSRAMLPQVTHKLPASPYAESYRFLGTDILLSAQGDTPFKTIMVATAKPAQGGTSTICNLAITLAQAGQTVALVDADMRRPSLHRIFNLPNDQGLTTVLQNGKLPSDVLQRTEVENLYVMPGGPQAENAWKLLRSAKMREVILDLSRDFDFVLFDTPSAVVFADAATLATMVDGVLLVVRAHESPTGSELQVKNLLNKTKARIVGVVMNDVPVEQVDSARFFTHYYASSARPEAVSSAAAPALPKRSSHDDEI